MLDMQIGNLNAADVFPSLGSSAVDSRDTSTQQDSTPQPTRSVELPDEARVIELLESTDGVSWQQEIMSSLEWSPSKTSRRLSDLEKSEQISRYQIGRQKIVCLPDREPAYLQKHR